MLVTLATARAAGAAPPETAPVWVQVASALTCPRPASVLAALRQRLGVERVRTGEAPSGSLVLRVEPHGARGVSARLAQAGVSIVERTIDVGPGECARLGETLALVTDSWLPATREAGKPGHPPSRAAAAGSPLAEGTATDVVAPGAGATEAPPTRAAPESKTAATRDLPSLADERDGPRAVADATVAEPGNSVAELMDSDPGAGANPASPSLPLSLELALGSALGIDTFLNRNASRSPVAMLRAGAELSFSPWRIGLRGQLETAGDLDDDGRISIRHSSFEALLGADIHRAEHWALGTSLAFGADVLAVNASYSRPVRGLLLEPCAAAGVRAEWRALPPVDLTAALEAVVALRREHFLAERDDSWHTPRLRARISIGALWHLP